MNRLTLISALIAFFIIVAPTRATTLTLDPNAGTLSTGSGFSSSVTWNGVTISARGISSDGAREYVVYGNLNVRDSDTIPSLDVLA